MTRRKRESGGGESGGGRADGAAWLYGIHAVGAALANPRRRRRRLVATREAAGRLGPAGAQAEILPRPEIAALLPPGAAHQGLGLLADPLPPVRLAELRRGLAAAPAAVLLALDRVADPRNLGATLRAASAFGAAGVIVPDRHAPHPTGALAKAASGALETVPLVRTPNLARALETLQADGFWCAGLAVEADRSLAAAGLAPRTALVLGAEGRGLRRLTRETCDLVLRIPGAGPRSSLNVAAAAAVALYEYRRGG